MIIAGYAAASHFDPNSTLLIREYATTRDFVPFFDFFGLWKYSSNIKFIPCHKDTPFFDHFFRSPTFRDAKADIYNEALKFIKDKQ